MKFDRENWREIDINIDSLWLIGPRAKGGKRENNYHGNFVPQIPDHLIRRYTEEGDIVLEPFMGSGTTLFECERLGRHYIGFDINAEIIDHVNLKMQDTDSINYHIHLCDATQSNEVQECIKSDLKKIGKQRVDFVLAHPPYWDIVKFTEKPEDLSNTHDLKEFISQFVLTMKNAVAHLRSNRHFAVVIGDVYRDGEIIPLGFYLMYALKKEIKCKLKGIVVKDMVGNRGKIGQEALWRYRTLKSDTFLFKHEYIFVFRKC
ncbi:MAG: DNA adenine methylase [Bacteroidaceae bacterium]|nr:DNA adenine methylase [Bacteroidaceae bacterium]